MPPSSQRDQPPDWGAGLGHLVAALRRRGLDAEGVELSSAAREMAWQRNGVRLLTQVPAGRYFDAISLYHSLEHAEDPCDLLLGLRDSLAPQGILFSEVPHVGSSDILLARWRRQILSLPPPSSSTSRPAEAPPTPTREEFVRGAVRQPDQLPPDRGSYGLAGPTGPVARRRRDTSILGCRRQTHAAALLDQAVLAGAPPALAEGSLAGLAFPGAGSPCLNLSSRLVSPSGPAERFSSGRSSPCSTRPTPSCRSWSETTPPRRTSPSCWPRWLARPCAGRFPEDRGADHRRAHLRAPLPGLVRARVLLPAGQRTTTSALGATCPPWCGRWTRSRARAWRSRIWRSSTRAATWRTTPRRTRCTTHDIGPVPEAAAQKQAHRPLPLYRHCLRPVPPRQSASRLNPWYQTDMAPDWPLIAWLAVRGTFVYRQGATFYYQEAQKTEEDKSRANAFRSLRRFQGARMAWVCADAALKAALPERPLGRIQLLSSYYLLRHGWKHPLTCQCGSATACCLRRVQQVVVPRPRVTAVTSRWAGAASPQPARTSPPQGPLARQSRRAL